MKKMTDFFFKSAVYFPPLHEEMGDDLKYLTGNILNAGSGSKRTLNDYVKGTIINQDIYEADNIDIVSPLHHIPKENGFFDSIICNAVLEHVENPIEVVNELARVIKSGGYFVVEVPFMQPEHKCPTDYQRYTLDGLVKLVKDAGFDIVKADGNCLNVYHTLGWIVQEWLRPKKGILWKLTRAILFPILRYKSRTSKTVVHTIASAYRIVAIKK